MSNEPKQFTYVGGAPTPRFISNLAREPDAQEKAKEQDLADHKREEYIHLRNAGTAHERKQLERKMERLRAKKKGTAR